MMILSDYTREIILEPHRYLRHAYNVYTNKSNRQTNCITVFIFWNCGGYVEFTMTKANSNLFAVATSQALIFWKSQ